MINIANAQGADLTNADLRGETISFSDLRNAASFSGATFGDNKFLDDDGHEIEPENARLALKALAEDRGYTIHGASILTTEKGKEKAMRTAALSASVGISLGLGAMAFNAATSDNENIETQITDDPIEIMCNDSEASAVQTVQDVCESHGFEMPN